MRHTGTNLLGPRARRRLVAHGPVVRARAGRRPVVRAPVVRAPVARALVVRALVVGGLLSGGVAAGCSSGTPDRAATSPNAGASASPSAGRTASGRVARLEVTSAAFSSGSAIPRAYACDGDRASPPLAWSGSAPGARAYALIVDDPDAPGGTYTHWVVIDIPTSVHAIARGRPPLGIVLANTAGRRDYDPPCPPSGTHHYRFTVYALRHRLGLPASASISDVRQAIESAEIGAGRLTGTYTKH